MKTIKNLAYTMIAVATMLLSSCVEDKFEDFSKDYDVPWKVSTITNVSPLEAAMGASVTLQGENLGTDLVAPTSITFGNAQCEIISQTATSIVVKVPTFATLDPVDITIVNNHNRKFVFGSKFTPLP